MGARGGHVPKNPAPWGTQLSLPMFLEEAGAVASLGFVGGVVVYWVAPIWSRAFGLRINRAGRLDIANEAAFIVGGLAILWLVLRYFGVGT